MIYIDNLANNGWKYGKNCHMFTDGGLPELHIFAMKIGMKPKWFQNRKGFPHYDLTSKRRMIAVSKGAKEVDRRFVFELMKKELHK